VAVNGNRPDQSSRKRKGKSAITERDGINPTITGNCPTLLGNGATIGNNLLIENNFSAAWRNFRL
jgi:hypothetical protein